MGVPDASLLDLFLKVRSWISWGVSGFSSRSADLAMVDDICETCNECRLRFREFCYKFNCRGRGRFLCGTCVHRSCSLIIFDAKYDSLENCCHWEKLIKCCTFCSRASKRNIEKIYPSESLRGSPEPPSPYSDGEKGYDDSNSNTIRDGHACDSLDEEECNISSNKICDRNSFNSGSAHPLTISVCCSPTRSDEEVEGCGKHFFSLSSKCDFDSSDVDTSIVSFKHECYSYQSVGSSPSDSPSRININMPRAGHSVQHEKQLNPNSQNEAPINQDMTAILIRPEGGSKDLEHADSCIDDLFILQNEEKFQKRLDFENNDHIWFPPPPEDEYDETKSSHFEYDDDDDEIGESGGTFSSSGSLSLLPGKEKRDIDQKEFLKSVIQGHFRALVLQLLQGESIQVTKENESEDWLDVISKLAWQAANFVKPNTSEGGSMDPGAYVKIKCVASGSPDQSALIKGIVCTKNIKHKRMTSLCRQPKLLLFGGSLEYQRAANQLASFHTLLEEELNHLKIILSKIEAYRPNVLLVEKSASPYAQEYLLAKEISLVLNVKRPLLERIARCTGASIIPSLDNISVARLGHCELFRLEKVTEELEASNQFNRRPSKTLMFFQGCPRRLGCTILLKGLCHNELKKVKRVVQYAVFAAYHLSLETSFLADEGAKLPNMTLNSSFSVPEKTNIDKLVTAEPKSLGDVQPQPLVDVPALPGESPNGCREIGEVVLSAEHLHCASIPAPTDGKIDDAMFEEFLGGSVTGVAVDSCSLAHHDYRLGMCSCPCDTINSSKTELLEAIMPEKQPSEESERIGRHVFNEYFVAADSQQSILVSFSSRSVTKGTVCEHSQLLRIKFYGSFDKPLGSYLRDDLFEQASYCRSCKEPVEAHVRCYTHQQGSLTINVRYLSSQKLPGQRDGKIWMWHRCLLCAHKDGVPPATHRVLMSDTAWGLSFGKFLELSFSNHATANRVASCGHSLRRDCLRFYGCGNMVAFFHYSPIDILSVRLPPSMLEFNSRSKKEWLRKETIELKSKVETLFAEIAEVINNMEQKSSFLHHKMSDHRDLNNQIVALKDLLARERNGYYGLLDQDNEYTSNSVQKGVNILELNSIRHSLLIGSYVWEHRFCSLDSILTSWASASKTSQDAALIVDVGTDLPSKSIKYGSDTAENAMELPSPENFLSTDQLMPQKNANLEPNASENYDVDSPLFQRQEVYMRREITVIDNSSESLSSSASSLSDKIDSAWTGMDYSWESQIAHLFLDVPHVGSASQDKPVDHLPVKRLMSPARVYSFDSATRLRERLHKMLPPSSLQLLSVRSFPGSCGYRRMFRDPISGELSTFSLISSSEAQRLSSILSFPLSYVSSAALISEGARLLLPQIGRKNLVIAVYDDEPTSVISYALSSKEHEDWINKLNDHDGSSYIDDIKGGDHTASSISPWPSFGSLDLDYISYGSYGSEDASPRIGSLFNSAKKSPHLRISFEDVSASDIGKAKFSVTCYFAKQFDMLRRKCCPSEVDFVHSLSRCKKWSAQGGKSNVYFAKSMDDRFIIKQVTKTELESFEEFAPDYFRYLTDSLNSGSPTCLAKVLGIYQVSVKNLKGGKETKMDLVVMENIFFKRTISRIYDLKGSSRSRYNPDTQGTNKVLLDLNLLEALRTNPLFLGSKAKRRLERAVWNDTSFLAYVDVMDYSLLVGVDEEHKELVLGIIDFMRQYTWDKHLETWVKASGILGGPKNASPTVISPKQYKRRFRKAMTTYFLTMPDQWSS